MTHQERSNCSCMEFVVVVFWAKSDNLPGYLHLKEKHFKVGSLPYLAAGSFVLHMFQSTTA